MQDSIMLMKKDPKIFVRFEIISLIIMLNPEALTALIIDVHPISLQKQVSLA